MKKFFTCVFVLCAMFVFPFAANAATYTWDGDGAAINNLQNGDTVVLTSTARGTLSIPGDNPTNSVMVTLTSESGTDVEVGSSATIRLTAPPIAPNASAVNFDLDSPVHFAGTISGRGLIECSRGVLTLSGDLIGNGVTTGHNGNINVMGGELVLNTDYAVRANTSINVSNDTETGLQGTLTNNRTITINENGRYDNSSGTTVNNGRIINNGTFQRSGGTVTNTDGIIYSTTAATFNFIPVLNLNGSGGSPANLQVAEVPGTPFDFSKLTTHDLSPTQTGMEQTGWFTSESGGTAVSSPYTFADNETLYAQWDTPILEWNSATPPTITGATARVRLGANASGAFVVPENSNVTMSAASAVSVMGVTSIEINNGATLTIDTTNGNITFNNTSSVSGAGNLRKTGERSLSLREVHHTGTTEINAGTLTFNVNENRTLSGKIFGDGVFVKMGASVLTLLGEVTLTDGATVSGGTLVISNSITGDIFNAATVEFNNSADYTYSGIISGAGSVEKRGAGTLTFSGFNTYTGDTSISAGTLVLGRNLLVGTNRTLTINAGATLSVNSGQLDHRGIINNNGTLIINGGTLNNINRINNNGTFTRNSGTLQNSSTTGIIYGSENSIFNGMNVLTFNANGGSPTFKVAEPSGTNDFAFSKFSSNISNPTRDGFDFLGWATTNNATTPTYTANDTATFRIGNENVILYAVWEKILPNYTLVLSANGTFHENSTSGTNITTEMAALGATVSGEAGALVLTLNNFNFETTNLRAMRLPVNTTIQLANGTTNSITNTFVGTVSGITSAIEATHLTISGGGTLNATGRTTGHYSTGMQISNSLTINGGATVNAAGGNANSSDGILIYGSSGSVNVSENANLTAVGNATSTGGFGIFADVTSGAFTLNIDGGTVAATGKSYGISSYNNLDVNISGTGAQLTASGGYGALNRNYLVPSGLNYSVSANADGSSPTTGTSDGDFEITNAQKWIKISTDFGDVPATGVPSNSFYVILFFAAAIISTTTWTSILRKKFSHS